MADIEKVLNGLKTCVDGECAKCPYGGTCSDAEDFVALARDALELLKSQRPVKPHRNYKYLLDYWCACGWHLGKAGSVKFCPECGRKVDWKWVI